MARLLFLINAIVCLFEEGRASSEEVAELRRFPAIPRGTQVDFSATLTRWRCRQSRANPSPVIPAEQGKIQGRTTNSDYDRWADTCYLPRFKRIIPMGSLSGSGIIIDVSGMKVLEEN